MPPPNGGAPEQVARQEIDKLLGDAGWVIQSRDEINLSAGRGIAIQEFKLAEGFGYADYVLFVDEEPLGTLKAKPLGHSLGGTEPRVQKYASGLPSDLKAPVLRPPFLYHSTGADTRFINLLDPDPRTRRLVQNRIHEPETLAEWLTASPLPSGLRNVGGNLSPRAGAGKPSPRHFAPERTPVLASDAT